MGILAKRLKEQAKLLGLSGAEVARRSGLEERRYAHYVAGRRKPDVETLVAIASVLNTTPNHLLGVDQTFVDDEKTNELINRFVNAASHMSADELELCVIQAEAVVARNVGPNDL